MSDINLGTITSANGMFSVTNSAGQVKNVDLGTLMAMLQIDHTKSLDDSITDKMGDIKARNTQLSQMTEFLSELRKLKAEGRDDGDRNSVHSNVELSIDGISKPLKGPGASWASEFGLQSQWTDVIGTRDDKRGDDLSKWNSEWDANISLLKNRLDTLNSDSQRDMVELQQLMDKRGTAMDEARRGLEASRTPYASIIRNL
jgi:hypothetical protein